MPFPAEPQTVSRRLAVAVLLGVCGAGCSHRPAPVQTGVLTRAQLTANELRYGRGAVRDRSVVYQPDVVIVDRGPDAIRAVSADELTWTIDAHAAHADELRVGKIALVTGRCVGRVLTATREADSLELVLGPVLLTDVVRDIDLTLNTPVDLSQAVRYPAPQFGQLQFPVHGADGESPAWAVDVPRLAPRRSRADAGDGTRPASLQGPIAPGIPQTPRLRFHSFPVRTSDGVGIELRHEEAGVRLVTQVQVRAPSPSLDFHLSIVDGNINARLILHNAVGFRLAFIGAVSDTFAGNVSWYTPDLGGFSIPLAGPVPLSVTVKQGVWVQTAFSAKQSMFSAGGDYDLNADLGITVQNRNVTFVGPQGVTVARSLMNNMSAASMGPSGLVISHEITITGGLGVGGFTAGPTLEFGTSVGVAQGSSIGLVRCEGVAIAMSIRGGVGWTIPAVVQKIANFFLTLIRVQRIPDHDGVFSPWQKLFQQEAQTDSPVCGGAAQPREGT